MSHKVTWPGHESDWSLIFGENKDSHLILDFITNASWLCWSWVCWLQPSSPPFSLGSWGFWWLGLCHLSCVEPIHVSWTMKLHLSFHQVRRGWLEFNMSTKNYGYVTDDEWVKNNRWRRNNFRLCLTFEVAQRTVSWCLLRAHYYLFTARILKFRVWNSPVALQCLLCSCPPAHLSRFLYHPLPLILCKLHFL